MRRSRHARIIIDCPELVSVQKRASPLLTSSAHIDESELNAVLRSCSATSTGAMAAAANGATAAAADANAAAADGDSDETAEASFSSS